MPKTVRLYFIFLARLPRDELKEESLWELTVEKGSLHGKLRSFEGKKTKFELAQLGEGYIGDHKVREMEKVTFHNFLQYFITYHQFPLFLTLLAIPFRVRIRFSNTLTPFFFFTQKRFIFFFFPLLVPFLWYLFFLSVFLSSIVFPMKRKFNRRVFILLSLVFNRRN